MSIKLQSLNKFCFIFLWY